ncbi:large ribosomal subunit protein bL33m isoform X2 [Crocuta crocuta]
MFLSAVTRKWGWRRRQGLRRRREAVTGRHPDVAKSKSKTILVKMLSQAGTGYSFNTKRSRLREKLTLLHYDPIE